MEVLSPNAITRLAVDDAGTSTARHRQVAAAREAAVRLEGAFLSEMLKSAGMEGVTGNFGGGPGEAQTASFLRDAQARLIAEAGGIGLADSIFESIIGRLDDD